MFQGFGAYLCDLLFALPTISSTPYGRKEGMLTAISRTKPVAKLPSDRAALLRAAISGNPKFFFGSDSAPHPIAAKKGGDKIAAGVFTQPYTTQSVVDVLEKGVEWGVLKDEDVTVERLKGFMGDFGRRFYKVESEPRGEIELRRGEDRIMDVLQNDDQSVQVVPFRRGEKTWGLSWVQ